MPFSMVAFSLPVSAVTASVGLTPSPFFSPKDAPVMSICNVCLPPSSDTAQHLRDAGVVPDTMAVLLNFHSSRRVTPPQNAPPPFTPAFPARRQLTPLAAQFYTPVRCTSTRLPGLPHLPLWMERRLHHAAPYYLLLQVTVR